MHQEEDIRRSHMDTTPYYQQITSSMLQDQNQMVNPLRKHEDHDDEINMAALASSPSGSSTSNDDLANCHLTATISGSKQRASLKCPRCDSTDTKFCYFNNYSQKQPRHYCKTCKRYWTHGGALRNVPVGGGCRKNKRGKHRSMPGMLDPSVYGEENNIMGMLSQRAFPSFGGGTTSFEGDQTGNIPSMNFQNPINYSNPHFSLPVSQFLDGVSPAKYSLCRMQNSCGCIDVATCSNCAQAGPPRFIDNLTGRTLNFDMSDYRILGQPSNSLVDQGTCNAYFNVGNCMRPCGLTSSATATLASIEDQLTNYLAPASLSSGSSQLPLDIVRQPEVGQPKVVEKDFQELIHETTVKRSSYHDCGEEGLISLDAEFKNKQKEEEEADDDALLDQLLAADESMRNFIDPQGYEQDGQHAVTTEEEQVEEFLVEKPMMGYMDFSSDAPLIMNDKVRRTDATMIMDDKVLLAGAVMMMKDEELPVAPVDGSPWTSAELQATEYPAQAASGHPGLMSTPAQQYIEP